MEEIEVTYSCGNVFADLDLPDADLLLSKAEQMHALNNHLRLTRYSKARCAKLLQTTEEEIDRLKRGKFNSFSFERIQAMYDCLPSIPPEGNS